VVFLFSWGRAGKNTSSNERRILGGKIFQDTRVKRGFLVTCFFFLVLLGASVDDEWYE